MSRFNSKKYGDRLKKSLIFVQKMKGEEVAFVPPTVLMLTVGDGTKSNAGNPLE